MTKLFKVGGITKSAKHGYKVRFATDMTRVKILAKTETDIQLMELPTAMDKPALVAFLKSSELYANPAYREAIDMADAKYNGVVKVTKAKSAKPSMEAIKARATKSTKEVVAE
jgi:transcriptional regulator of aromatic amino acid metabolism